MKIAQFPKSEKKLQEFLRRNLEAFQKNVMKEAPVEIMAPPEIQEEWVKKYSEVVLTTEPYTIISFLDENDINIIVDKIGGIWLSKINNNLLECVFLQHANNVVISPPKFGNDFKCFSINGIISLFKQIKLHLFSSTYFLNINVNSEELYPFIS